MTICWEQLLFPAQTKFKAVVALTTSFLSSSTSTAPLLADNDPPPSGVSITSQEQRIAANRRRRRQHQHQTQAVLPPYGFAAEWLRSSPQPLRCIDFHFNTEWIHELAFSPDGSFLVYGSSDNCVRLWNIRELIGDGNVNARPIPMETEHCDGGVTCVAVSLNNRYIFSGGFKDKTVLIHDSET